MRMAAAALLALMVAGCLGGGNGGGEGDGAAVPDGSGASSSTTTGPPPRPVPTVDTLHLLAAPLMTPDVADLGQEARTPVTAGGFGQGDEGASWAFTTRGQGNVTGGELQVWVDILEPLLHAELPNEPPCTWRADVSVGRDTPVTACLAEPPGPIMTGTKKLTFRIDLDGEASMEPGEEVLVTLRRSAYSPSPNNAVDALSGTAERDSFVKLEGLREPVAPANATA